MQADSRRVKERTNRREVHSLLYLHYLECIGSGSNSSLQAVERIDASEDQRHPNQCTAQKRKLYLISFKMPDLHQDTWNTSLVAWKKIGELLLLSSAMDKRTDTPRGQFGP